MASAEKTGVYLHACLGAPRLRGSPEMCRLHVEIARCFDCRASIHTPLHIYTSERLFYSSAHGMLPRRPCSRRQLTAADVIRSASPCTVSHHNTCFKRSSIQSSPHCSNDIVISITSSPFIPVRCLLQYWCTVAVVPLARCL